MKKVFLAMLAVIMNMFLFSCTTETVTETEDMFRTLATEGDDEDPPPPPPDDEDK